jgi:transitional endoplasmic reticulum ATPase
METFSNGKQTVNSAVDPALFEPEWVSEMCSQWQSGRRAFGLVFNVNDYVMTEGELPCPLIPYLCQRFESLEYLVVTYSISGGLEIHDSNEEKETAFQRYSGMSYDQQGATNPHSVVLKALGKLLMQNTMRVLVIINYGQHIVPAMQAGMAGVATDEQVSCIEQLNEWALDNYFNTETENAVVTILREGHYHDLLSEHWRIIRVGLPNEQVLERFYNLLSNLGGQGKPLASLEPGITAAEAAHSSIGLRLRSIEELSRHSFANKQGISLNAIKTEKAREIRTFCGEELEVLETDKNFSDIAGLEHVKNLCNRIKNQIKKRRRNIPLALLFIGPPGCGKSYVVRAFANELDWNALMMRTVRSKWVGESERNLERLLNAIDSNLPAIVFIDEVDQMLGQRSQGGDSGTSERMLARLWEFMAENQRRGRLIFVAATNRPDLLDPATVDRFQYVIPLLHPTADEFRSILPVCAAQLDCGLEQIEDLSKVADVMNAKCLSIRQSIDILAMAALKSDQPEDASNTQITEVALIETLDNFKSNHDPHEIEAITLEAIRMTTFGELLPWYGIEEAYRFPRFINPLLDDNNRIINESLHKRIAEIRRQRTTSQMAI